MANEAFIMICAYHFFVFTDFVPNARTRFQVGYSLIVIAGLSTAVNLCVIYLTMLSVTYHKISGRFKRWKQKQMRKLAPILKHLKRKKKVVFRDTPIVHEYPGTNSAAPVLQNEQAEVKRSPRFQPEQQSSSIDKYEYHLYPDYPLLEHSLNQD